jgi:hypothetical protein
MDIVILGLTSIGRAKESRRMLETLLERPSSLRLHREAPVRRDREEFT